jgi:hypothetical protein
MHYVCIENNNIVGIQSYEPAVPNTVVVVTITDDQHNQIMNQTHKFDIATKTVVPIDTSILSQREQEKLNAIEREFLNSTDWQILRHLRQKTLGVTTSLTEEQYLALEQQRQAAASRIVQN